MKTPITLLFLLFFCGAFAQNFKSKKDVLYVSTTLPAIREAYIIDAASLPTIANSNVAVVVSAASTLPAINYTFSS